MSDDRTFKILDEITRKFNDANSQLNTLIAELNKKRDNLGVEIQDYADSINWTRFKPEYLKAFVEEPYVIEPSRIGKGGQVLEWKVFVAKMIDFPIGRLERATHSHNVYTVNQYMRWFGDLPEELTSRFPQIEIKLEVQDGILMTEPDKTDAAFDKYRKFVIRREGPGYIRVKKGSEWELIAQILEDGALPFVPQPVDHELIRDRSFGGFALSPEWDMRSYQQRAWDLFLEYGAIGIYWPFGAGKSEFGIELCDCLAGHKLIIAGGTSALRDQWNERLEPMPEERRNECHVVLYQSKKEIQALLKKYKEFVLIIFDECHHLPAKTFMWMSTLATKYRLGLTGSPYREDGHINYIIALTGMPDGLAWNEFVAEGFISLAQIQVHIVRKPKHKLLVLDELLKRDLGTTLIYSDSLDIGREIADRYGLKFIYSETPGVILDAITGELETNGKVVVSRVGDEGISIDYLDTVIEVDFLGGSRAQALQRAGRLQHRAIKAKEEPAVHHILMTEQEADDYAKRLLAYYDKGYRVDWLYNY